MRFYYFHGYGSSPEAKKCLIMKEYFGADNVFAPDFNKPDSKAVKAQLDRLAKSMISSDEECYIIGSSLGGLYALYVSAISGVECLLLNPCLFPQLLAPIVGETFGKEDIVTAQELNLKAYLNYNPEKVRVWVTKDDDLIDHSLLTKPFFFYNKPAEYLKIPKKIAKAHDFLGFAKALKMFF